MHKGPNQKDPSPIDVEVGRRIRMRRRILGMSQTTLAEGLNVTFQQVQKYEKGKNRVGASRLQSVADCLDVPVSFFFEGVSELSESAGEEIFTSGSDLAGFLASGEGIELNRAFAKIKDARMRLKVVSLVKSLVGPYS
ncbi:helix-turn-helix domain-containing protein [Rhizobium sp. CNPSo 3464]|uniref:helix-turn-helix domain-containing protein n=1 Tax=Rhizobium sp. CNPSo 3464 TaxID=3021406 RepID=UPI00255064E2|nr:helix-turn-helix domain-containing protein [Rhizobium sp. CNPSo 3464]MDK4742711.1 helix-turn-helix domain-containing protein [Rhizobium sp. CNPSo 3464]